MTPQDLLRQLAEHHEQNLGWLRRRLGSTVPADEVEDVLQSAYARALAALGDESGAPAFADVGRAQAWLRTIALNHALDVDRRRRGRSRDGRRRPEPISIDGDALPALTDDRVQVEDDVLDALERDARQRTIGEAIATLEAGHRQILQLRYGHELDPPAIMVLEGLNRRQWEGRHTRALKALGRALGRLQVGSECARTRRLLRRPADLLGGGRQLAIDHVAGCVACGAFARSAQYALASPPLPLAIAAWRYEALERLARPRAGDRPQEGGGTSGVDATGAAAVAGAKLVATATAVAVGAFALVAGGLGETPARRSAAETSALVEGPSGAGMGLAAHETPAQALERSAQEMARRRARARREATGRPTDATAKPMAAPDRPGIEAGSGSAAAGVK